MGRRDYIEYLLDNLSILKDDAPALDQCVELSPSVDFFDGLAPERQPLFVYLALTRGDDDVKRVANRLRGPLPNNSQELLALISPTERAELEDFLRREKVTLRLPTEADAERITRELREASSRIGYLKVEEAFWALVPSNIEENTRWIEAAGGNDSILSRLRLQSQVIYEPTADDRYNLMAAMRKALIIIHVHNHPELPGYITYCKPSPEDLVFATYWKSLDPDLEGRMKFFVVKGKCVVEYSLPQDETKPWMV